MYKKFVLNTVLKILKNLLPIKKIAKKIYPQDKFIEDLEIDVRSTCPISFSLGSRVPEVNIYLKVINKSSYLDCVFDKASFSLWLSNNKVNQPIIKKGWFLAEEKLREGETKEIFYQNSINNFQVDFLKKIRDSKEILATLYLDIYIKSELYDFQKSIKLENKNCKIDD